MTPFRRTSSPLGMVTDRSPHPSSKVLDRARVGWESADLMARLAPVPLASLLITLTACGPDRVVSSPPLDDSQDQVSGAMSAVFDPTQWMATKSDSASLADLTIPGSHESAALYEPIGGTAKCQSLGIREQLDIGVRSLDIRVRQVGNAFVIHHGSIYANFDDVLGQCVAFLVAHPSETIVMEVSPTYTSTGSTETNEATFMRYANNPAYAGSWWRGTSIPRLGAVRGKIVLLRRFGGSAWTSGGIDVTGWQDNAQSSLRDASGTPIVIQDFYTVKYSTNDNKWSAVTALFTQAAQDTGPTWYIDFTSGYRSFLGIPDITGVSNDVDARLIKYFAHPPYPMRKYGTIVSDFVSAELVREELTTP